MFAAKGKQLMMDEKQRKIGQEGAIRGGLPFTVWLAAAAIVGNPRTTVRGDKRDLD